MRRNARSVMAVALVVAAMLGTCGGDDKPASSAGSSQDPNTVEVSVALPLEDVTNEIVEAYKTDHPDAQFDVTGHGQDIITDSIKAGEPDVAILPAAWLAPVGAGLATGSFGRNLAVIAVPSGNPGGVTGASAFAPENNLRTAVCAEKLSRYGNLGELVLAKSGVTADPSTVGSGCENDALQQVAEGQLDAALVFRGGLHVPDGVELLDIDESQNQIFDLSYAVIDTSPTTAEFAQFLASDDVRQVLTANGYLP